MMKIMSMMGGMGSIMDAMGCAVGGGAMVPWEVLCGNDGRRRKNCGCHGRIYGCHVIKE